MVKLATLDKQMGATTHGRLWDGRDIPTRQHPKLLFTGISLVGKEAIQALGMTTGRNCIILLGEIQGFLCQPIAGGGGTADTGKTL